MFYSVRELPYLNKLFGVILDRLPKNTNVLNGWSLNLQQSFAFSRNLIKFLEHLNSSFPSFQHSCPCHTYGISMDKQCTMAETELLYPKNGFHIKWSFGTKAILEQPAKVPILKEVNFGKMQLCWVEHFYNIFVLTFGRDCSHLSTAVAWREIFFKYFVFYTYFGLVNIRTT